MKPIPLGSQILAAVLLLGAVLVMATGGCRKSAGTAEPMQSTRVCTSDAGRKDVISRPEVAVDTASSTVEKDASEPDTGPVEILDSSVDVSNNDAIDVRRDPDASPRADSADAGHSSDSAGTGGAAGGSGGSIGGSGGSTSTGGLGGATGTGGSGGTNGSDAAPTDARDAPLAVDVPMVALDTASDTTPDMGPDLASDGMDGSVDLPIELPPIVPEVQPDVPGEPPEGGAEAGVDVPPAPAVCSIQSGWAIQMGSNSVSYKATELHYGAFNQAGDVFVTGNVFSQSNAPVSGGTSVDLGSGVTLNGVNLGANVLISRLDSATGSFAAGAGSSAWVKAFGDDLDQVGVGIAASSTNVAIIGNYVGSMGISGLPDNFLSLPVDFVVGLDPATGNPTWAKKIDMGGLGMASIYSNPNLTAYYLCGASAIATTDLKADLSVGATDGKNDIVVAKINAADGAVMWARQIGGAGIQICSSIVADGTNVYVTGTYQGTLDFGNGTGAFPAAPNAARKLLWVAKLSDSDGTSLAAKTWGSTGAHLIRSITVDKDGNVLVAGQMAVSTIPFGGTVGNLVATSSDALLVKLDSNLSPLWAHNWGDSATQDLRGVATDSQGRVFAVGLLNGSITSGGTTVTGLAADVLTMTLDQDGNVQCLARYGDTGGDQGDWLVVDRFATGAHKDRMVFGGLFGGTMTVGGAGTVQSASLGTKLGYVVATP